MSDLTEADRYTFHMKRIMDNLEQHWHSIQTLLGFVSKPLLIDDRGLGHVLRGINDTAKGIQEQFNHLIQESKALDIAQALNELKYIGKRLYQIEQDIAEMKAEGVPRKIEVDLTVDGYKMVKKPRNYDKTEPVEEPDEGLKELLDSVTERHRKAVIHRLGLFGEKAKTYEGVGEVLKVSRNQARNTYMQALYRLRHPSKRALRQKINHKALKKLIWRDGDD